MVSADFAKQVAGYGLTTASILYRMPDAPSIINPHFFVWQEYDLAPKFPRLLEFLNFWQREIDGKLVAVRVAHSALIKPAELRTVDGEFRLH